MFGLPGNPVSAVVTFSLFVAPGAGRAAARAGPRPPLDREAVLGEDVARNPRREQAVRVRLAEDGRRDARLPTGAQGSHILTSLLGADALAMIPAGDGVVRRRDHGHAATRWRAERSLSAPMACRASETGTIYAVIAPWP